MIPQKHAFWWSALNAASRYGLIHFFSGVLPYHVVTEYPKCGGSWVSQMLSEYFALPFPRNRLPMLRPSIMHCHYLYSPTMRHVYVVMRDGRDVMVSLYYYSLFALESGVNHSVATSMRKMLPFKDYNDISQNLPRFIEHTFLQNRYPRFTWSEFVNSWIDRDVPVLYYENLLDDAVTELGRAIYTQTTRQPDQAKLQMIVEKYSFTNQAGRSPGEENIQSFLRKGIAGDWKNHFSLEAKKTFHHFAGPELIRLGYESDDSWIGRKGPLS